MWPQSSRFLDWNSAIAAAARQIGQTDFPAALGWAIQTVVPFNMINGFAYRGAEPPVDLYNAPPPHLAATIVDAYLARAYVLDPFFAAVQQGTDQTLLVMQDIAPDRFSQSEYYKQHYSKAEIRDEVGYVLRLKDQRIGVLSLTRKTGQSRFSRAELLALRHTAPLVCALGEHHWNSLTPHAPTADRASPILASQAQLTQRETEIVRFILRGHSTESIGLHLKISLETVKVHRKNLYKKLRISTQAELFSLFIEV